MNGRKGIQQLLYGVQQNQDKSRDLKIIHCSNSFEVQTLKILEAKA